MRPFTFKWAELLWLFKPSNAILSAKDSTVAFYRAGSDALKSKTSCTSRNHLISSHWSTASYSEEPSQVNWPSHSNPLQLNLLTTGPGQATTTMLMQARTFQVANTRSQTMTKTSSLYPTCLWITLPHSLTCSP